jgi:aldose 1-epimerase
MTARYQVAEEEGGAFRLTDGEARSSARIVPALGNNVLEWRVQPEGFDAPIDVFLPPAAPGAVGAGGYGAGNPILFPFPNRVRDGRYTFDGQAQQLDVNEPGRNNHIHGLVARAPWQTEDRGADASGGAWHRAAVDLQALPDVPRQYPFPCRLTVLTRLLDGALVQEVSVRNTGPGRLPMGFGTHPWFPATIGDAPRAATEVRVPGARYWRLAGLVPTGETVPVTTAPAGAPEGSFDLREWKALDGNAFDDVFTALVRRPDGWSEAGIRYPNAGLELRVEASPVFREWVIYAPSERPVVCLEPYTGTTDAVNLQPRGVDAGLVVLEPGATWEGTIRTSLRRVVR